MNSKVQNNKLIRQQWALNAIYNGKKYENRAEERSMNEK
jgi:hypothetical protein